MNYQEFLENNSSESYQLPKFEFDSKSYKIGKYIYTLVDTNDLLVYISFKLDYLNNLNRNNKYYEGKFNVCIRETRYKTKFFFTKSLDFINTINNLIDIINELLSNNANENKILNLKKSMYLNIKKPYRFKILFNKDIKYISDTWSYKKKYRNKKIPFSYLSYLLQN